MSIHVKYPPWKSLEGYSKFGGWQQVKLLARDVPVYMYTTGVPAWVLIANTIYNRDWVSPAAKSMSEIIMPSDRINQLTQPNFEL